jgi:DhnA family fructose-bisphosphate aldolase class Ia
MDDDSACLEPAEKKAVKGVGGVDMGRNVWQNGTPSHSRRSGRLITRIAPREACSILGIDRRQGTPSA